jgi:phasin family protein
MAVRKTTPARQRPQRSPAMSTTTATTGFEQLFASNEKMFAAYGDLAGHGKANMEAMMAAAQVSAKGASDAVALLSGAAKSSFDRSFELAKNLSSVTSVQQAVELQADFAKTGVETALKNVGELTGIMTGTAKDALRPITERISTVMANSTTTA